MTTTFFRLLHADDKEAALRAAVNATNAGEPTPEVFRVDPASFGQVPGSPFAYWVSERVRRLFVKLKPFESEGRKVERALSTTDDFRFLRLWWEPNPFSILDGMNGPCPLDRTKAFQEWCRTQTFKGKQWVPFAKGGPNSPYYSDLKMLVNWKEDGKDIEEYVLAKFTYLRGNANWLLHRECDYFRPGLTWPIKNRGTFKPWPLPGGCIFAHVGAAAFVPSQQFARFHALLSSDVFTFLLRLRAGWNYEAGVVRLTPVPDMASETAVAMRSKADACVRIRRVIDSSDELSHVFILPSVLQVCHDTIREMASACRPALPTPNGGWPSASGRLTTSRSGSMASRARTVE